MKSNRCQYRICKTRNRKIEKLENTIKVNEATSVLQMRLLNTKAEANIHINQTELSTLQKMKMYK